MANSKGPPPCSVFCGINLLLSAVNKWLSGFEWSDETEAAFQSLKESLIKPVMLAYPRSSGRRDVHPRHRCEWNGDWRRAIPGPGWGRTCFGIQKQMLELYGAELLHHKEGIIGSGSFCGVLPSLPFGIEGSSQDRSRIFKVAEEHESTYGNATSARVPSGWMTPGGAGTVPVPTLSPLLPRGSLQGRL